MKSLAHNLSRRLEVLSAGYLLIMNNVWEGYLMRNRLLILGAAFCLGWLSFGVPAHAQMSTSGPQYNGTGITTNSDNQPVDRTGSPLYFGGPSTANAVFVGGTPIMRVRLGADGYTADERASQIQERVNLLLGEGPIMSNDITTAMEGADAVVLVKGQLLFTADSATARYNDATPMALANTWANHLREVLPGLTEPK
jgi:hypothetical protein